MRTNRFQGFTTPIRTSSLRRLKTALSPSRHAPTASHSSNGYPSSSTSADTTSPLSLPRTSISSNEDTSSLSPLSSLGDSPSSTVSSYKIRQLLNIRAMKRRPSIQAMELEEEKKSFENELTIMEPRPKTGFAVGHDRLDVAATGLRQGTWRITLFSCQTFSTPSRFGAFTME
ncbi:hypothetical protein NA57DRAFT_60267 [Rhizodiscina lignyota]|uniref:Uncharacterized protein n=1 Tax=Rhizodiscina lignyota TaxID=1504668 RepID=A0A9P4M518_9PEZI|nr:hypothetical protein NA57DRAFT_60267 [Rhizodiscina lignyota]